MDSKKFGFRNFDLSIRFAMKNESEIEKFWNVGVFRKLPKTDLGNF